MRLSDVTWYTEDPAKEYVKGLAQCDTLEKLRLYLAEWDGLVDDAAKLAGTMTEKDFKTFAKCLKKERSGKFSGMKNIVMVGTLIMPELMFKASTASLQYVVPWGTAVIRLRCVAA